MSWFMKSPDQTVKELGVDPKAGLSASAVEKSREKNGANAFTRQRPPSFIARILSSLKEPMLLLLIAAAVITLAVNFVRLFTGGETDFIECVGIFVAIFLSTAITVAMEGRSQKAFEALNKIKDDIKVKVLRDGKHQLIPQKDLVVGDIVFFETGDKIPADGRILESIAFQVDESSLTGESVPAKKDEAALFDNPKTPVAERSNMVYSGCYVTAGSCTAVITAVGDQTEFGAIAKELTAQDSGSTPLQEKLAKLSKTISILGIAVAGLVFLIQIIEGALAGGLSFVSIADAFISSIILIVASVPEGLPTIVAISLALNIIKMAKQNALVKKMIACETVGSINVICSDKTGTLTENRMTVTDLCAGAEPVSFAELPAPMAVNFAVNSTAQMEGSPEGVKFMGSPTECALLAALAKAGHDYQSMRSGADIAYVYPFSSETKNMTTLCVAERGYIAYCKGSPEKILRQCSKIALPDGEGPLTDELLSKIEPAITGFQQKAGRVLGFAHRALDSLPDLETEREKIGVDMVFDGFVSISDPLRADVYDAVMQCKSAGIDLKMLTGDNIVTATAIAGQLGLLEGEALALEAWQIDEMSDQELKEALPKIRVIARSTPVVKMRVVKALKSMGNVVAVTGDGINDAPAIKNADVGIAMGITGTEVSKEASDIVLMDDSFSTIVRAVHWGRGIYQNFQRFIQFQLTVNVSAVLTVLLWVLLWGHSPFSALQLLWVNIIMDGPPALTLGLEPISGDLMKRAPTPRNASIVNGSMLGRIVFNGLFITGVFMLQSHFNFMGGTAAQQGTILFTLFVLFQLFNAFNARVISDRSIFKDFLKNRIMLLVFAITLCLQLLIVQFGGSAFNTVPLEPVLWLKIIAVAFSVVVASELFKLVRRLVLSPKNK